MLLPQWKKGVVGIVIALVLMIIGGTLLSTAQAQYPYRHRDRYYRHYNNQRNNAPYYNQGDQQKGYHDGFDRGREDAQTHRTPTPNNSEHFRNGNPSYRNGFRRGYNQAYRQFARGGYRRY